MAKYSIAGLVDAIIEESAKAAASEIKVNRRQNGLLRMYDLSQQLTQQYAEYTSTMQEYNNLAKDNAKLKRQINKYGSQSNMGASLSARLEEVRQMQITYRQQDGFMENARKSLVGIYKTIFALQNVVNRLEGQSIKMVYTSTRGGSLTTILLTPQDFPDGNMFGVDVDRYGKLVLRYNVSEIEQVVQALKAKQDQNKIITSSIQPKLEALYGEIIRRQKIASSKNSPYLMWQVGKTWYKTKLVNAGDLIEAYTNALITGESNETLLRALNGNFDSQIDALMNGYISQVSNKSGFFEEDVDAGNGQFYGVKSEGASLMGMALIVRLAQVIVTSVDTGKIDQKVIASLQRAFSRNTTRHSVEIACDAEIDEIIEELGGMIGNSS